MQGSGVVGEQGTLGDDITLSGVWNQFSYSIGQFHFRTDGFRQNNDQTRSIYNLFGQLSLSPETSVQAEVRFTDVEKGDLELRFDPENYIPAFARTRSSIRSDWALTTSWCLART